MLSRLARGIAISALMIFGLSLELRPSAQQPEGGLTPPPRPGAGKPAAGVVAPGSPFTLGERLTFNVSWSNFVTAARVEMEIAEQGAFFDQPGYQLRARAETTGHVRSLFVELDHQYISYVAAGSLLPYRLINSTRQGPRQSEETIILDQTQHAARYADGTAVQLPGGTYDLPSLVYALRARDLTAGANYTFTVLYDKELIEVEAQVKPRERVITQAGSYDAVRVDLNARLKKGGRYRARAFFSDDAQRLPVLITAQPAFGEIRAELSSAVVVPRVKSPLAGGLDAPRMVGEVPSEVERGLPFGVGERLNYDVSWLNLASVGRASFEVRQQGRLGAQRVFELVGEVTTKGAARALVNVDDQVISYAEVTTLAPVRTETRLVEGRRQKQTAADYNWPGKSVRLSDGTHVAVAPKTLDLVSLFYAARAANLQLGATHTFPFLDANYRPRTLVVKVMKQETIGGPLGSLDTIQLDVFSQDQQQLVAQVWVTNDARRLPAYIAIRARFGEIRLQLTSMIGTK